MPTCSKCGRLDTTVEMRRSPKKDESGQTVWMCKERDACKDRRRERRRQERALRRAASQS